MNKLFFFLIFFSICNIQAKPVCGLHEFSYDRSKVKVSSKVRICIEKKDNQSIVFSESCLEGKCEAVKQLKSIVKKPVYKAMGSPHYIKCHEMQGFPLSVVFKELLSSKKTMICFFKEDNSFLNSEALFLWPN